MQFNNELEVQITILNKQFSNISFINLEKQVHHIKTDKCASLALY